MRKLIVFLLLSCSTPYVLSQTPSPQQSPDPNESLWRQLKKQLNELQECRTNSAAQGDKLKANEEVWQQQKANCDRAGELAKEAAALADERVKLMQDKLALSDEKATMWKQLYESVTKKPGVWCRIQKVLTLGLSGCR